MNMNKIQEFAKECFENRQEQDIREMKARLKKLEKTFNHFSIPYVVNP